MVAGYAPLGSSSVPFTINGVASDGAASLSVHLKGATDTVASPDHHVQVWVNNVFVAEGKWDGLGEQWLSVPMGQSLLREGQNSLQITAVLDRGVAYSAFFLDSLEVKYRRNYKAVGDSLWCKGGDNPVVTVSAFSGPDLAVFDLSDPKRPKRLRAVTIDEDAGGFRASFTPATADTPYLVTRLAAARAPAALLRDERSRLRRRSNGADYLVIATAEVKATA